MYKITGVEMAIVPPAVDIHSDITGDAKQRWKWYTHIWELQPPGGVTQPGLSVKTLYNYNVK